MLLTLYDKRSNQKMEIEPSDSSTGAKALQADNVLSLSFVSYECQTLEVNDYIDFGGERFWATDRYTPKQRSTVEWEYDIRLYGIESLVKRYLVVKTVNGDNETEFAYTATAYDHLALIVQCINAGMQTSDWKVGEVVASEYLTVDYEGTYCDEALKKVADLAGVEYWMEGTTINLSRCQHGEPIALGYLNGLTSLYSDKADNVKFFTRLFPIGSTRNIAHDTYGHSRLQLPAGVKYIDQDTDKFGVVHHYEKKEFAHIYPRRIGKISHVRSEVVKGEEGKPFSIYYFTDSSLDFNPNDYQMNGLVKRVSFQNNSSLAGRDFEVNYNTKTKEFEIITQWPYDNDIQLPNEQLPPKVADEYILWNIKMPTEYYATAEAEFKEAVERFMAEQYNDVSVYKAHTDYIDIAERGLHLTLGQRVRLEHPAYFTTGYRDSRITKITRKVVRPTEMDIEISDVLSKGALEKVDDAIADVNHYTKVALAGLPEVIKSWESTLPTDQNLLSSKRSINEFVSKKRDDTVGGELTFEKGFRTDGFVPGMAGVGAALRRLPDGSTLIETDNLIVRRKMEVYELTIERAQYRAGIYMRGPADGMVTRAEPLDELFNPTEAKAAYYRCYFDTQGGLIRNYFAAGDMVRCQTQGFTADSGLSARFYWRTVVGGPSGMGEDFITLSNDPQGVASMSDIPLEGDYICTCGNVTDPHRMAYEITYITGPNTPRHEKWVNVNTFAPSVQDNRYYLWSPDEVVQSSKSFTWTTPQGNKPVLLPPEQWMGDGIAGGQYVDDGQTWLCRHDTTVAPTQGSDAWLLLVARTPTYQLHIIPSPGANFYRDGQPYNATLQAMLTRDNDDITHQIHPTQWQWQRRSEHGGDATWNVLHANSGSVLILTYDDLNGDTSFLLTVFSNNGEMLTKKSISF